MSQRDFPQWFKQVLSWRFDEHTNISANLPNIYTIRLKLNDITDELKGQLDPETFLKVLEWEETVNRQHAMEKEWLYSEGVRDGLKLMSSIKSSLEDLYPKH